MKLRLATSKDAEMIFQWRNAPETKRYAFTKTDINLQEHLTWFANVLASKDRFILIAELNNHPTGVFRFDLIKEGVAEVSIYLAPLMLGKGLGIQVLELGAEWIKENIPEIKELQAKILPENIASIKIFEKAGYMPSYIAYKKMINNFETE